MDRRHLCARVDFHQVFSAFFEPHDSKKSGIRIHRTRAAVFAHPGDRVAAFDVAVEDHEVGTLFVVGANGLVISVGGDLGAPLVSRPRNPQHQPKTPSGRCQARNAKG